jgi:hypothetical protein
MEYQIGRFSRDEALAQLAREYVQVVGLAKAERRATECERTAADYESRGVPTYAESFARHAEALRDAIQNAKETKAA